MRIDKGQVRHRFSRSASTYDQHAGVQKQMAHHLLHHLQKLQQPIHRICEIGCGTGYLTQFLIEQYPQAQIVAIDLSPQMIDRAKTKITHAHVHWVVGDAEQWAQHRLGRFDLIISNATMQWLSHLNRSLHLWREALHSEGWFIASTFGNDTFQEMSTLFQKVETELGIRLSRHHLPLHATLFWQQLLQQVGFTSVTTAEDWQQIKYPDCRTFLQTIKAMGASYSEATLPLFVNRRLLQTVMQRYDAQYRIGSQVYATYHVMYLYGQK